MHSFIVIAANGTAGGLGLGVQIPLSIMNFLEFAIWGAWFVVLGNYLNTLQFSRKHIGRVYATMALGAIISPMFLGTIADRYFASQNLMGVLHLVGAVLLFWLASLRTPRAFYWVALAYALVYSPTLALSNAVIFANVAESTDFAYIRVLGTIGWIAAGLSLRLLIRPGQQVNNSPLLLAAGLSLVLGVWSFFLPNTPPGAAGSGAEAKAVMGVGAVQIKEQGKGYTESPEVSFEGGGGTGAKAKAKVKDGRVTEVEITDPGKGFTAPPKVLFGGGGGAGAAGTASLGVAAIDVVNGGSGYKAPPHVSLVGDGKGTKVKPALSDGSVASIEVVKGGSGYTALPEVKFPEPGIPFVQALGLLKDGAFAVFLGVSFLITIALAFYYSFTALYLEQGVKVKPENIAPLMTIGQWVEIVFMLSLPWFIKRWDMKAVLALGMAAWGVRYAIFASRSPLPLIIVGIALHGICFDFFFAAGMIHTENMAPPGVKASAQSLFAVLTYGLGMYLGTEASGWLNQRCTREATDPVTGQPIKVTDWTRFWLVPCMGVLISLVLFLVFGR